jgi:thiol-disulfide isomerase/thioredoxin
MKNMVLVGALALTLLPACGREAGPSPERKAAADTTAPVASAAELPAGSPPSDPSAASSGAPSNAPGLLRRTTAEQLLADVSASGKKATLVNAWASWCGPCRREVPMLQALAANLKPQGVAVILVSVDDTKDEAKAASFLRDNGITLPSYLVEGSVGDFKRGINPRWPGMLPASFLFDANGKLVHFWGGEAFEKEIVPVVEAFLAGGAIAPETRYGLAPGKTEQ